MENKNKSSRMTKTKMAVDTTIFLGFLIAMNPHSTGVAVHEWLGVSALAGVTAHLLMSWDWVIQVTRRFLSLTNRQTRLNYLLNWSLFLDFAIILTSGLMISENVLPTMGLTVAKNFAWHSLHSLSTNVFLVLTGLHLAMNWHWITSVVKRYLLPQERKSLPQGKDVVA